MAAPQQLGPYRIGKPLGKGGMGTVYRAVNQETGQQVAVKTLASALAADEGFRERFEAEIESLRTLRHANIVRLFGFGEEDDVLFYSMELVEGVSLEEELRQGRRFDWREVCSVGIQVSNALKHAHDHGIIHRDIKPANILLSGEQVKLADFGIAQLFGATRLTSANGVVGTADFMSPEQAEGAPITSRSDQYSLGGVLYALLAGRAPFRAKSLPEMLQMQRYAEPEPVSRFAPDTPRQLEEAVMQLLAKDPKDRFPSTRALAKHLEALQRALSRPVLEEGDFELNQETGDDFQTLDADLAELPTGVVTDEQAELEYQTLSGATRDFDSTQAVSRTQNTLSGSTTATEKRFTIVSDEPLGGEEEPRPLWQSLLLGVTMLAVIAGIASLLIQGTRPQSADKLAEQIITAEELGESALLDTQDQIEEFLDRFPDDPRAAEIRNLQRQVSFAKAERRLMAMLRRRATSDAPLESLFLEAMRSARDHPEQALRMLRSVIDLMAGAERTELDESARLMLEVAEEQAIQLQDRVKLRSQAQLPLLEQRLEYARSISQTNPQAARRIVRAILDLYGQREWAAELAQEAHRLLSNLDAAR